MNNNINNMTAWVDTRTEELMTKFKVPYADASARALAEWQAMNKPNRTRKNADVGTGAPAPEKVAYENRKGETIMCTPKQVARFEELKAQAADGKARFDAMCAEWERKHAAYKPSEELIAAIKHDRAKVTKAIAESKYGFIGTKKELAALKEQVLAK